VSSGPRGRGPRPVLFKWLNRIGADNE
jgi:hypothetical protein